mmetsp:Transcript_2535/g.6037  ORF Transcript_2535/g.6037 Transcript_2535/m.6037 type:complete len:253 (+) Transcript_2535:618-1376(+)
MRSRNSSKVDGCPRVGRALCRGCLSVGAHQVRGLEGQHERGAQRCCAQDLPQIRREGQGRNPAVDEGLHRQVHQVSGLGDAARQRGGARQGHQGDAPPVAGRDCFRGPHLCPQLEGRHGDALCRRRRAPQPARSEGAPHPLRDEEADLCRGQARGVVPRSGLARGTAAGRRGGLRRGAERAPAAARGGPRGPRTRVGAGRWAAGGRGGGSRGRGQLASGWCKRGRSAGSRGERRREWLLCHSAPRGREGRRR